WLAGTVIAVSPILQSPFRVFAAGSGALGRDPPGDSESGLCGGNRSVVSLHNIMCIVATAVRQGYGGIASDRLLPALVIGRRGWSLGATGWESRRRPRKKQPEPERIDLKDRKSVA